MPEKDKDKSPKNVSDTDTLRKRARVVKEAPTGPEWEKLISDGEEIYVKRAKGSEPDSTSRRIEKKPIDINKVKTKYVGPPPKDKPKKDVEKRKTPPAKTDEDEVVRVVKDEEEPNIPTPPTSTPTPQQTGMYGSARGYEKIDDAGQWGSEYGITSITFPSKTGNYTNDARIVNVDKEGREIAYDEANPLNSFVDGKFTPTYTGRTIEDIRNEYQLQQIKTAGFDDVVDDRGPDYKGSLMLPGTKVTRMTSGGGGEFNQRNIANVPNALKGAATGYIEQKYDSEGKPIFTPNQGVQFNEENLTPLRVGEMEAGKMYDIPNTTSTIVPNQNKAKGGKIMAPKMKKYAVGGEVAGYNYQGQPIDKYGNIIENEGMTTEDVGKSALGILTDTAGKLGGSKTTTTTSSANASVNATSNATNSTQSGLTQSGGMMNKLGGKSAAIGAATDLGAVGAGLGAAYIDSKNKDARGRYENVESAVGSSALKGAALGSKMGSVAGPWGTLIGAGVGAVGGAIYGGVKGKKDVAAIKTSKSKMANELSQANAKRNQQRAVENRDAGILEGNLATPLTEGEAIYNEKDELINAREGGIIGAAKMRYAKGGTIVGKGGSKDDAIFTKANKEGIEPGSFIVPAENNEKAKGIRGALFGDKNKVSKFKKGGEMESNVAVSNGEHLFTPKERKKIVNYLGEEILEELAPNAEENSEEMYQGGLLGALTYKEKMREYEKGGIIPVDVASQKRTEKIQDSYKSGGYVVEASSDREGKTHKVTGPDGTVKYFGDSNLGQHPGDPERKKAFYARHKENLDNNPFFRAYARETWAEGGTTGTMTDRTNMREYKDGGLTKSKAKIMLHEGMANGKPITEQQRKYFGWVAGGSKQSKMDGGDISGYAMGTDVEGVDGEPQSNKTYAELITPPKSFGGSKESWKAAVDKSIKEGKTIPKGGVTTTATIKSVKAPSTKGMAKVPESVRFVPKMASESEGEDVIVPGDNLSPNERAALTTKEKIDNETARKLNESAMAYEAANPSVPKSPPAPRKGLADYVKNIDPGAAFSAYQIGQGSKLLKSGQRPEDVSKIDPAYNAAVERAQRDATFGYTPEQAAMLDQKAINALNDARFSGRNLAGGSAGTAFQQERQAINQGWTNALQLKSADQQLRMQKQQYADQAVKERADFLDMQRRRAFGDAMNTYNVNQESGSALVGAGVRNAIGAFRYQKELEAQERAAKMAGAPITTG